MSSSLRATLLAACFAVPNFLVQGTASAEMARPAPEMQAVLDELAALKARPVSQLDVREARMQASPADAALLVQIQKKVFKRADAPVSTRDIVIPAGAVPLPARIYRPEGRGPFPVILYFHGGGWVIADLNTYDATPRALAANTGAVVVSVDYRHAPEHPFPAAHEDAWNAYEWLVKNAASFDGDARRIAVAGESAGGNLAANVALEAKARGALMPVYQLLVYPVAGSDMSTPSYTENAEAKPLGRKDMEWFVSQVFRDRADARDVRINLVGRDDLAGLPPATVVTAEIDPLRSEGETYARRLGEAGVKVKAQTYKGVTHEFFGMGNIVPEAKEAMDLASSDLKAAFAAKAETEGN